METKTDNRWKIKLAKSLYNRQKRISLTAQRQKLSEVNIKKRHAMGGSAEG